MPARTLLALLASLCLSAAPAAASAFDAAVVATPGLLGYYPFTPDSQADSVVNGYTGLLFDDARIGGPGSGPPVNDPDSSALILPTGATGRAFATAGGSNPLTGQVAASGSIIAWINLASLPSAAGHGFYVAGESDLGNNFDLFVDGLDRVAFYTGPGTTTVSDSLTAANLGNWIFVAATLAGTDRNLYLDGTLVASSPAIPHRLNNAPFSVGNSDVLHGMFFDGAISDVGLFNTALTADQVASLYAARTGSEQSVDVPTPGSLALLLPGLAGLLLLRRAARHPA